MKNKSFLLLILAFSLTSCRTVEVTPGNQPQPPCPVNAPLSYLPDKGTVVFDIKYSANVKDKVENINKNLRKGDLVYFASYNDGDKYFIADYPFEVKDFSPLNFERKVRGGEEIVSQGIFVHKDTGSVYDIVRLTPSQYFLVDKSGFVCSSSYGALKNTFLQRVALPTVYQSKPLRYIIKASDSSEKSIAVNISHIDGAKTAFDVVYSINGKVVGVKTFNFSSRSGKAQIKDLEINFNALGTDTISVSSIKEPENLSEFARSIFKS